MAAKKSRKKRIVVWSLVGVAVLAIVLVLVLRPKTAAFTEETVKSQNLATYYSFSGNVEAKESQKVIADASFQVKDVKVAEGDRVEKDDVLFTTTQGQKIKAKISGEIGAVLVEEGGVCMAGTQLTAITDYDNLQVTFRVDEYDVSALEQGKEATVKINALGSGYSGTVAKVSKEAVTQNGVSYFTASVDLKPDSSLRVGMSAEVTLLNQSVENAATISMKALQFNSENQPFVYVRGEDGKPAQKEVAVGINDGTTVQITEGLNPGDTVLLPDSSLSDMMQNFGMGHGDRSSSSR